MRAQLGFRTGNLRFCPQERLGLDCDGRCITSVNPITGCSLDPSMRLGLQKPRQARLAIRPPSQSSGRVRPKGGTTLPAQAAILHATVQHLSKNESRLHSNTFRQDLSSGRN